MPEKTGYDDNSAINDAVNRDDDGSYRARTRLFVTQDLAVSGVVDLEPAQAHYLLNVLRLKAGAVIALFNGRDGEWRARIDSIGRGRCAAALLDQARPQRAEPDLWLLFAPLKKARTDYLAEKATEIGASVLWPVFTRRTQAERINLDRLHANAVEAAEQSERLSVPELRAPGKLADVLANWPAGRRLLFCDETGGGAPLAEALTAQSRDAMDAHSRDATDAHSRDATDAQSRDTTATWAVLIGPEGGFARDELDALRKLPFVTAAGLGPRILRADTAALAALVIVQALVGDWKSAPRD